MTTLADLEAALAKLPANGDVLITAWLLSPRLIAFVRAGDVFRAATEKFLNGATHPGAMAAAGLAYDEARAALDKVET